MSLIHTLRRLLGDPDCRHCGRQFYPAWNADFCSPHCYRVGIRENPPPPLDARTDQPCACPR